jgi:hypothetical protein
MNRRGTRSVEPRPKPIKSDLPVIGVMPAAALSRCIINSVSQATGRVQPSWLRLKLSV